MTGSEKKATLDVRSLLPLPPAPHFLAKLSRYLPSNFAETVDGIQEDDDCDYTED